MTYLIKVEGSVRKDVLTTEDVSVQHAPKRRAKDKPKLGGIFVEVETYAYDHSRLRILAVEPKSSFGRKDSRCEVTVPKSAEGVKARLRKLRQQEADALAEIDRQIEEAQQAVAALRIERRATVKAAWAKAHVVRLNELVVQPDPSLPSQR